MIYSFSSHWPGQGSGEGPRQNGEHDLLYCIYDIYLLLTARRSFDHWTTISADCGPVVEGPSWLSTASVLAGPRD